MNEMKIFFFVKFAEHFPKQFFTQFILIPLLIIYVVILYFYCAKIVINWQLPRGWVSYLVLAYSIVGIFALLLVHPLKELKLKSWIVIFSKLFYPMAWAMGIPTVDIQNAATLLGQKLTINEFVAFKSLTSKVIPIVTEKGLLIVSIAICGFANFSSVGMLIGGIGELAPSRRSDLAKLGFKALIAGTLASYLSATLAGLLL